MANIPGNIKTITQLNTELKTNDDLKQQMQSDPVRTVEQLTAAANPLDTDKWIYRLVVGALGFVIILIISGIIILMSTGKITDDKTVPTIFTAIGSAAIGALAGLLAPSPKGSNS